MCDTVCIPDILHLNSNSSMLRRANQTAVKCLHLNNCKDAALLALGLTSVLLLSLNKLKKVLIDYCLE